LPLKSKTPDKTGGKKMVLFCDGASRGNPGPGSYGFVIYDGGKIVAQHGACLGVVTNNVAEYSGLVQGLKKCLELGASEVTIKADSQLIIRQLQGQYKVRAPQLLGLYEEAREFLRQFRRTELVHVPREENKLADALANQALDGK
jgi:ribonuclease HI